MGLLSRHQWLNLINNDVTKRVAEVTVITSNNLVITGLIKQNNCQFINLKLTGPILAIPDSGLGAQIQPFHVIGDIVRISLDEIVSIGPAYALPVLGLITPLKNAETLSIGSFTNKTAIVIASVLDDATEGYYETLKPTPTTITFTTNLSANLQVQPSKPITTTTKSTTAAKNPLQTAKDMEMRLLEEMIITKNLPVKQKAFTITPPAVGDQTSMYIDHGQGYALTLVTCVYVSNQGNFWIDNNYLNDPVLTNSAIKSLADFWDNIVYAKDTTIFGMPTDTDGDPRINIIFSPLERIPGDGYVVGYFSSSDKFPRDPAINPYSNERDMIYLTIPLNTGELSGFNDTLAHEFQHMINFDLHYKIGTLEIIWVNEGMSELAGALCTDTAQDGRDVSDFLSNAISLTIWCYNGIVGGEPWDSLLNYSASRLFALYLYDRFVASGVKPNLLKDVDSGAFGVGMQGIASVTGVPFDQLFQDWMAALYLSNRGITEDPKYNFTSINLQSGNYSGIQLGNPLEIGSAGTANIYPYSIMAFPLKGITSTSKLTLSGNTAGGLLIGY